MALPVSPVLPGADLPETVMGANQPEYEPLPAFRHPDGTILTRWRLTWRERLFALWRGDVYLWVLTFNHPLQPVMVEIDRPALRRTQEGETVLEAGSLSKA